MKKYIIAYIYLYICSAAFSQNTDGYAEKANLSAIASSPNGLKSSRTESTIRASSRSAPSTSENLDLFSVTTSKIDPELRLYFATGASYNFDISQRSFSQTAPVFFDVPFRIALDVRFIAWFSLYSGIETTYAFHLNEYEHEDLRIQSHNMYIRLPLLVRFYPMFTNEAYRNVYLALGGFAHFWPVQFHNIYDSDTEETSIENGYFPVHPDLPPAHVYTPANAGISFAIGNSFPFGKNMLFGLELFMNYMFLPYKNGYYANPAFQVNNQVLLSFYANIGLMVSIGIDFELDNE